PGMSPSGWCGSQAPVATGGSPVAFVAATGEPPVATRSQGHGRPDNRKESGMGTLAREGLRPADLTLLSLLCLGLFGFTMVENQVLTTHEAVHCQNVREMWTSHDWIIPTYGGRPWLERPPLPHWATGAFVALVGQPAQAWTYRGASVLAGMLIVLMTAWMASLWYGRGMGMLAG